MVDPVLMLRSAELVPAGRRRRWEPSRTFGSGSDGARSCLAARPSGVIPCPHRLGSAHAGYPRSGPATGRNRADGRFGRNVGRRAGAGGGAGAGAIPAAIRGAGVHGDSSGFASPRSQCGRSRQWYGGVVRAGRGVSARALPCGAYIIPALLAEAELRDCTGRSCSPRSRSRMRSRRGWPEEKSNIS